MESQDSNIPPQEINPNLSLDQKREILEGKQTQSEKPTESLDEKKKYELMGYVNDILRGVKYFLKKDKNGEGTENVDDLEALENFAEEIASCPDLKSLHELVDKYKQYLRPKELENISNIIGPSISESTEISEDIEKQFEPEPVLELPTLENLPHDTKDKAKKWYGTLNQQEKFSFFDVMTAQQTDGKANNEKGREIRRRLIKESFDVGDKIFAELTKENPDLDFDFNQNKLPSRKGFEPQPIKPINHEMKIISKQPIHLAEKMFDEKLLAHKVEDGDSLWKILKKIFENDERLINLTKAQKIHVLNHIAGMVFENPAEFGLSKNGALEVGNQIDLSGLNGKVDKIKKVIEESKKIITPGSFKEKETLNLDPEWSKESVEKTELKPELTLKPVMKVLGPEHSGEPAIVDENQLHQEIVEAKQRIIELENAKRNPNLERSLASDSKSYISNIKFNQSIKEAFEGEIDRIYGKKGLLGMGKTVGVKSKEWEEMAKLPAHEVVEYYTGDSTKSGLSPEIIEKLTKSKTHEALMKQTADLMKEANGAIKPDINNNENMEQFIKRLGGYVLKTHLQKTV